MSRRLRALASGMLLFLPACSSNPQRLPVGVSQCAASAGAGGVRLHAEIENRSDRPISELVMNSVFYQNFRYERFSAQTRLSQELDPGDRREVVFEPDAGRAPAPVGGQAMRCYVTHIRYMDGTSADAPVDGS
ncbi:MAG TPA: hypothetical protein VFE17_10175 [Candidatus Baltobacteraceae bacterium]|jgi:hypothetical protein|nr:hypothetical protein [Candidatus Baltobacteraceae bacterium]